MPLAMWLKAIILSAACVLSGRRLFHYFQLESYQFRGYFRTIRRMRRLSFRPGLVLCVGQCAACLLELSLGTGWTSLVPGSLLLLFLAMENHREAGLEKAKKPFSVTARIRRLYAVVFLVLACLMVLLQLAVSRASSVLSASLLTVLWVFLPSLLPCLLAIGAMAEHPLEAVIQKMYLRDARRILHSRTDLIRIGVTGSYGKTSVKFILGTLLSERYQVLVSPASFNTPMGLTKVIRNQLLPAHQVFVAEMGARHVGDIAELCRLVRPEMGVLVSVGPQHLDTFGTLDRIRETKYELIRAIPENGHCFFFDDGDICRQLYDQTRKPKSLSSLSPGRGDIWAESIHAGPQGSTFDLCTKDEKVTCSTRLLGRHNIQNLVLAASVCLCLGMTLKQIARGIQRVQCVEHRLQLMNMPGGITMIDDAFNSNPRGASAALQVLREFGKRRIIVTPGMVELGDKEEEMNYRFGVEMADCADVAILVGPRHTEPIRRGLLEKGFPQAQIHTVASLQEASDILRTLCRKGDTVLLENDLPDNYSET